MPLFEFKCKSCSRRFAALVGVIADAASPKCPSCGSEDLSKLLSRFSTGHSEEDMLENLADPDRLGDLDDPSQMRKYVKEMGKELGEDLGDEFDEYLESGGDGGDEGSEEMIH